MKGFPFRALALSLIVVAVCLVGSLVVPLPKAVNAQIPEQTATKAAGQTFLTYSNAQPASVNISAVNAASQIVCSTVRLSIRKTADTYAKIVGVMLKKGCAKYVGRDVLVADNLPYWVEIQYTDADKNDLHGWVASYNMAYPNQKYLILKQ